jgi:dienelactone hydrolase
MKKPTTVQYAERGGAPLLMDLHHPGGPSPQLIMFAYGGGFTKGNRDNKVHTPILTRLLKAGFAVAVPDYRLNTTADDVDADTVVQVRRLARRVERQGWGMKRRLFDINLFTACQDLSAGIDHCRSTAGDLKVSANKVGMLGVSAGGLAGNTLCYPPGVWSGHFSAPDVMVSLAAPAVYDWRVRSNGPPLWIIHGKKDRIIPSAVSVAIQAAAERRSAPVRVTIPDDAPHIGIDKYLLEKRSENGAVFFDEIIDFFSSSLKKAV